MPTSVVRRVAALSDDTGQPVARLDPETLAAIGAGVGGTVAVTGRRTTVARVQPLPEADWGRGLVYLDSLVRANAGAAPGERVRLWHAPAARARGVSLRPLGWAAETALRRADNYLGMVLDGTPVMPGDRVRPGHVGTRWQEYLVEEVDGEVPAVILAGTEIRTVTNSEDAPGRSDLGYADVGGLGAELQRVRELVELPLRHPDLFTRMGVEAPKGVLLYGPPGCGKTLIARAVAAENRAHFIYINGPEIMHKFYGQSEANLRAKFDEARAMAPSILFLDELDAIAPRRTHVLGDVEKRVVAQLLTLMDGLDRRGNVVVIGASNLPEAIDPALRRPGRFDREICVGVPDRCGRLEVLQIHTRQMPLAADVDLDYLADVTHGHVGADLAALCREAALSAIRRSLPIPAADSDEVPLITMADFQDGLREVEPSALREVNVERPNGGWEQVGGLEQVKEQLEEAVVRPLRHAELYRRAGARPSRGVLITGPPGSGKTLLAHALAGRCGAYLVPVSAPDLLSRWAGETEKAIRAIFRRARGAAPCVVLFDGVDLLFPARGTERSRTSLQLISELDSLDDWSGLVVVGTAAAADQVDPALLRPGRLDPVIALPLPDAAGRAAILGALLGPGRAGPDVALPRWVEGTAGWTGAELAALVGHAARAAVAELLARAGPGSDGQPPPLLSERHLAAAMARIRPGSGAASVPSDPE